MDIEICHPVLDIFPYHTAFCMYCLPTFLSMSLFLNKGKPVEDINELLIKAFKIKRYRIIRCIELTNTTKQTHTADTRKGVAVKHIPEQFTTKKEQGVTHARTHELYDKTKKSDPHADRSFLV